MLESVDRACGKATKPCRFCGVFSPTRKRAKQVKLVSQHPVRAGYNPTSPQMYTHTHTYTCWIRATILRIRRSPLCVLLSFSACSRRLAVSSNSAATCNFCQATAVQQHETRLHTMLEVCNSPAHAEHTALARRDAASSSMRDFSSLALAFSSSSFALACAASTAASRCCISFCFSSSFSCFNRRNSCWRHQSRNTNFNCHVWASSKFA